MKTFKFHEFSFHVCFDFSCVVQKHWHYETGQKKIPEWQPYHASWFTVSTKGKHYFRFVAKIKTRKHYKPFVPDEPYRTDHTEVFQIEEELKRGESGDPLPITMIKSTLKTTKEGEYRLWREIKQPSPDGGPPVTVKAPHPTNTPSNSSLTIDVEEAGFMFLYNCLLQQRFDLVQEALTNQLPPTDEQIEQMIEDKGFEEPLKTNLKIKLKDYFNIWWIGVHQNGRAMWDTVNHVGNMEHRELYRVLDDPQLRAQLYVRCYQRQWHVVYGDFTGTLYVACFYVF